MKTHKLKCWPEYFEPVLKGLKTAELRINDRDFQVGDQILLQEYDFKNISYTKREILIEITHITNGINHLQENHVMLSFKIIQMKDRILKLNSTLLKLIEKEIEKTNCNTWYKKPERWWDDPTWRCTNNHVNKIYLKSEEKGCVCVKCGNYICLTFPEDKDGELCSDM